jgi:hypothetical protein
MGLFGEEAEGGGGEADEDIVRRCRISRLHSTSKAPVAVPPPRVLVIMFFDKYSQIYFTSSTSDHRLRAFGQQCPQRRNLRPMTH